MRLDLSDGHVDLRSGDVVRDDQPEHRLREKERQLLAYLAEHAPDVVTRGQLYTDIWGYHPQTRSRTLDSTVRRLRKAIEVVPRSPRHVLSVPGEGYRFVPVPRAPSRSAPARTFTPYLSRPVDEARIRELLDGAWRVVSVVGPGGVGKTRVSRAVASERSTPVVVVDLGALSAVDGLDDLVAAVAQAAGVTAPGATALSAALGRRQALCLLDEAEEHVALVDQLVDALEGIPFLITSRRALGRADEAVHQLSRLDTAAGCRFLEQRLAASRWGDQASDADKAEVVDLLDGLPLALELAAAHPDGLVHVVDTLRQERFPDDAMRAPLQASLSRLSASELDLLQRMALCTGPLRTDDLVSWLGPAAAADLRTLADRSLVERRGRGWSLLRTTRVAVREADADWEALRADLDGWLAGRTLQLAREMAYLPGRHIAHMAELVEDVLDSIPRQPAHVLPWLAQATFRYADYSSSLADSQRLVRTVAAIAPDDPIVRCLKVANFWAPQEVLDDVVTHDDAVVRAFAMEIRAATRPDLLDPRAVSQTAAHPGQTEHQAAVLRAAAVLCSGLPPRQAAAELQKLEPDTLQLPMARAELLRATAEQLRLAGQPEAALRSLRACEELEERHNPTGAWVTRHLLARVAGDLDPADGIAAHLANSHDLEQGVGLEAYDYVRAGVLAYLCGQLDDARAHIGGFLHEVHGETRTYGEAVHVLLQIRAGQPPLGERTPADDPDGPNGRLFAFLTELIEAEVQLAAGEAPPVPQARQQLTRAVPERSHRTAWQLIDEHLTRRAT